MRSRTTQQSNRVTDSRDRAPAGYEALHFPGTAGRVVLPPDPALRQALAACLSGWVPKSTRLRGLPASPLAAVAPATRPGRYHLQSRYVEEASEDLPLASTVCALIADLSQNWAETARGTVGLHGGAVAVGGQLLLITGPARAGKSTLVTRLAAAPGVTFFCDDVLPVNTGGEGIALGIAPRLRLPAPPSLAALAHAAIITADDHYGYIRPPLQAPHGSRLPVAAILLLDRREGAAAQLHRLDPAEAVATLLRQSITGFASAEAAFARARALTRDRPCLRLVCSDLDEAAELILRSFTETGLVTAPLPPLPALPRDTGPQTPPAPAGRVFSRAPLTRLRRHGASAWLWQPGEAMLWELNPVAHAVWLMLDLPGSATDFAAALAPHFPDIPETTLTADIARLLADLQESGLISAAC
ncbi:PqqD family peptide modification chaperone [Pseudogemmobacter bohemicus]|uniref:PqqD family peptide modification chaperone n=1 Tax=Pseudogemmobacter bohemicus TaxID=2250708 RepID=UPI000DD42F8E|nr:PqqD family peptide modification chaperone [Pseudogemmobacter bohemicus]